MHNIQSPRTDDAGIENVIKALGADKAPRITPEDLVANIAHTEIVKHITHSGQVLRWAVLTTRSGYAVVGRPSVSVSPENDKAQIGAQVAIDNSKNELWPLMGYELKCRLAAAIPSPAAANTADSDDFLAGVKACSINDPDCEACQ